tara:strand:+ start:912 stop:1766 length:855 start_codon:yes stop_codon:yes gene_type:complete
MNRSLLFVPGHKIEYIKKLKKPFPDVLVIDLEDSVPNNKKEEALLKTQKFFKKNKIFNKIIYVRINYDGKIISKDLKKLINKKITGFIIPKVKYDFEISKFIKFLNFQEKIRKFKKKLKISFIVETVQAVLNLKKLLKFSNRINFIIYGEEDYHAEINDINFNDKLENDYAKKYIPIVAKANNIQAIYTPYLYLKNKKGLKKHILNSINLGYSGLLLIHPSQIEISNKYFYPLKKDLVIANDIIKSNRSRKYEGQNISVLKNKLVGPPMIKRAQKIVNRVKKTQ